MVFRLLNKWHFCNLIRQVKKTIYLNTMKMNKIYHVLILMLFCSQTSAAQDIITLKGTVQDNGEPLANVACFLKNNNYIGDLTDKEGHFSLILPKVLLYDSLVISCMGFDKQVLPLTSIAIQDGPINISLIPTTTLLPEVVIRSDEDMLKELMLSAFSKIPKNYPKKAHQLEGFYRKVSTRDHQFTHLQEASITIQDKGYRTDPSGAKIRINEFRQSQEWDERDSLLDIYIDKSAEALVEKFNVPIHPMKKIYEQFYLRMFKQPSTHFNWASLKKYIDQYQCELVDQIITDGDTVYQIAFRSVQSPLPLNNTTYVKINAKDLAIVEYQFNHWGGEWSQLVKFKKFDGRYYPQMIQTTQPRIIDRDIHLERMDIETIWFDLPKTKTFQKIKSTEAIDRTKTPVQWEKPYTPDFWNKYKMHQEHPLEQGVKKSLEMHRSLDDQFKSPKSPPAKYEN